MDEADFPVGYRDKPITKRKTLLGIFDHLNIYTHVSKPLPKPPHQPQKPETHIDRICLPKSREIDANGDVVHRYLDPSHIPHFQCSSPEWKFNGNTFEPSISLLYACKDASIPSSIRLTAPNFIVPWRYQNRTTHQLSWKIIHITHPTVLEAESETLVVSVKTDAALRNYIQTSVSYSKVYSNARLVNALLQLVQSVMGTYGSKNGSTSAQCDQHLVDIMSRNGHNFVMLGEVRTGLCRHKAMLFKVLCDASGINCALITGYSTGGRHQLLIT